MLYNTPLRGLCDGFWTLLITPLLRIIVSVMQKHIFMRDFL
jgi:uncharacterized membrane protein